MIWSLSFSMVPCSFANPLAQMSTTTTSWFCIPALVKWLITCETMQDATRPCCLFPWNFSFRGRDQELFQTDCWKLILIYRECTRHACTQNWDGTLLIIAWKAQAGRPRPDLRRFHSKELAAFNTVWSLKSLALTALVDWGESSSQNVASKAKLQRLRSPI